MGSVLRTLGWVVLFVVCLPLFYLAYISIYGFLSEYTWREAVALGVETPVGMKTGRSVRSVTHGVEPGVPGFGARGTASISGEATVVEVAPGQFLFALLHDSDLVHKVFPDLSSYNDGRTMEDWRSNLANARMKREIPSRAVNPYAKNPSYDPRPLLVRFRDINDPRTVEKVDPDNLAASFGPGFKLKSYTLELLGKDEPVTRGKVEKVLGWLPGLKGGYLHGGFTSREAPLGLHAGNFSTGSK